MEMEIDRIEAVKKREQKRNKRCCIGGLLIGMLIAIILFIFYGCTTVKYVPVVEQRTDTVQITKQQRDSIWLHDSIYMHEYTHGDTTYILRDRWHTKYIESIINDTTYIASHDTVPKPYPVEVEVEKKLSWWQQTRIKFANAVLLLLLIWGVAWGLKTYFKKFL